MLKSILKVAVVSAIGFSSVACTTTDERVARYGVGGAAIGTLAGTAIGGSTPGAALTGAAFGALAGVVTGEAVNQRRQQNRPHNCVHIALAEDMFTKHLVRKEFLYDNYVLTVMQEG